MKHPFYFSSQTDRQYTVYLNITNEDYKEGLRDPESLEFLNFAQAVRAAVSKLQLASLKFSFFRKFFISDKDYEKILKIILSPQSCNGVVITCVAF